LLVLVTGATGFLGRRVVRQLQEHGHDVRCLVHTPGRERMFPERTVDVHYGSVLDADVLSELFYDVGAVIHLVSTIGQFRGVTFDQVNRQGVANVVASAVANRVKHFIQVSVIGATNDPAYAYFYSKWRGEREVAGGGVPYTIIRSSLMFGEGDVFINPLAALTRVFPLVPVVGSGRNRFQPIAVDDVARCIVSAVDREDLKGKTIEIGGPQQLSYNEIMAVVARTMGKRRLRIHLPMWLVYLAAATLGRLKKRPLATSDQLRMLATRNVAEPGTVEQTFGFTPRTLEGNIEYVKTIGFGEGLRVAMGSMPSRIRDH